MTFIIAGRVNEVKFLMVDTIGTSHDEKGNKTYTFSEKLKRLTSNPKTFFTMTGSAYIAHLMELYDTWLHSQNIVSNFNSQEFMNGFLKFIDYANNIDTQNGENLEYIRFFFLSEVGLFFIDLNYDKNRKIKHSPIMQEVKTGYYTSSNIARKTIPIETSINMLNKEKIREYCLQEMNDLAYGDSRANLFSNRVQLIIIDGDIEFVVESAYKYPSDVLAHYFRTPYHLLDDSKFRFEL